jgi:uncharacterized membrane protein YoaK (UPF0700 family)
VSALGLLTLGTGLVDAASVLGLGHVFTANMTGNVVFLGFSLAGAGRVRAIDCAAAIAAFLVGALFGGRLAAGGRSFRFALAIETLLLAGAAASARLAGETGLAGLGVITGLALAMGVQNASVRRLAVADMTTTVLTLTLTGLAADSSWAGGSNPRAIRRATSVVLMLAGALLGALVLRQGLPLALGASALIVGGAAVVAPAPSAPPGAA